MLKVLVADDEPLAREAVVKRLAGQPDIHSVSEAAAGDEAVERIRTEEPDVVFLDIQMPELNGFEVLARVPRPPVVVFVTAYSEFAVSAFGVRAVDYLLKPINDERFEETLTRVREAVHANQHGNGRSEVHTSLQRIMVRTGFRTRFVEISEVEWIEAADYYSRLHLLDGRSHLVRESLSSFAAKLDRKEFVRVHRSAIVRASAIREFRAATGGEAFLTVKSGARVKLSQRGRQLLIASARAR